LSLLIILRRVNFQPLYAAVYARRRVPPTQTLIISSAMPNCQLKLKIMTKRNNLKKKIQFEKMYSISSQERILGELPGCLRRRRQTPGRNGKEKHLLPGYYYP
jgi:hypothetical protein